MIEIIGLKKELDGAQILDGINLTIEKHKTTVVIGESGCGKTVLLKHIIGFYEPDEGSIICDGEKINGLTWKQLNLLRQKMTMVFQHSALFDWLSVYENIALPLREQLNLSENDIRARVNEKLAMVGMTGQDNKTPAELSFGMQKRVSLARALVLNPEYVLFDEPTTGLDPIIANNIIELFSKFQRELHTTSLIVSHDISIVFKIADKVALLKDGKIIFQGSIEQLERSKEPYIKKFISR
ncbi:MAG TPA: ATP-binding cassette domain-containing protein [Candidatus Cloacimonetes bacterium]|nr:ATP-binding cassette domain-containing protein [Candidatus Cloacimonadota bacterium]HEX38224.1 ATP-binding cassette domain-containing protein [Candidatus Cloacimonadota bacterium]